MFKKLAQKLSADRERYSHQTTNPMENDSVSRRNSFLNKLTQSAVNLYERQADIKKFTKLVLSDPENKSHDRLVDALFSHGIVSIDDKKTYEKLSNNKRFLDDLNYHG